MEALQDFFDEFVSNFYIPKSIKLSNILEIIILAFLIYEFIAWIKTTKVFSLLKGLFVIFVFWFVAYAMNFTTILWIGGKVINYAIIALFVIFQPELRRALEQLGQKKVFSKLMMFKDKKQKGERFSENTITSVVTACFKMGKVKTGALIVVQQEYDLYDIIKSGIEIDAVVSNQLLINIFEHNTPLHDGAVIMVGDRIVAATCYLPLSRNMDVDKELGTRHRAALGMSEETDALIIVVSEETGKVSVAMGGQLYRNLDQEGLKKKLLQIQKKTINTDRFKRWRKGAATKDEG